MIAALAYAVWMRSYDLVLPLPMCLPLFEAHSLVADTRASHAVWVAINLPCGDF